MCDQWEGSIWIKGGVEEPIKIFSNFTILAQFYVATSSVKLHIKHIRMYITTINIKVKSIYVCIQHRIVMREPTNIYFFLLFLKMF